MNSSEDNTINFVSFNQDKSCFSVGTNKGFQIFNTNPYKPNFERGNIAIYVN